MDRWLEAGAAFGGLTGIGVLIDLAMYKSEKAKLKAKLEDWWLRFDDVKWSNFGRNEAELAVQILDRWADPQLLSWRRWIFSTATAVLMRPTKRSSESDFDSGGHWLAAGARYCWKTAEVSRGRLMDRWLEAGAAFGGLTGIGVLIDLAMYKSEKAKLKAKLEDWWLRFDDVKWSNFGRNEAELAVQILDRWADPQLLSWRRWIFSTATAVLMLLLSTLWVEIRVVATEGWGRHVGVSAFRDALLMVPAAVVLFAVSLSLTRLIAELVAKLSIGSFSSVVLFATLLLAHVALLLYWSFLVEKIVVWSAMPFLPAMPYGSQLQGLLPKALSFWPEDTFSHAWHQTFSWHLQNGDKALVLVFKAAMDMVANGIRIVFALVFLSSFVLGPQIKGLITRLWHGAMESNKPVFTTLFGAVGAVVAAVQVFAN